MIGDDSFSYGGEQQFAFPSGVSTASYSAADRAGVSPNAASTIRDLAVRIPAGGPIERSITLTVNSALTAVSCTVTATTPRCNSGGATAAVPAGAVVGIAITSSHVNTATPSPSTSATWAYRLVEAAG